MFVYCTIVAMVWPYIVLLCKRTNPITVLVDSISDSISGHFLIFTDDGTVPLEINASDVFWSTLT